MMDEHVRAAPLGCRFVPSNCHCCVIARVFEPAVVPDHASSRSFPAAFGLDAAGQAVRDRFRAIFLTSVTTIAGMLPLLSETSLQAQVLIPLVASVVFGMISSTFLLLLVLPAAYAIMEDLGIREVEEEELAFIERSEA